ncbi:MAG: amidohydrolase family protein [Saprospiraceae bacterium]|nr:amidohydrolase family protein [Saprospiraceae bacterium]
MSMRNVLLLILLISQLDARSQSLLLKDVNVVPMSSETVLSHQDVRIEGDRIVDIASAGSDLEADIVIHASGQYLIPGLAEMHAHIPVAEDGNDTLVRETLFLYLANGITTIRGMLGNPYHLDLKKQVNAFEFPAPRVYTSSPSLNGNTITTKEEARQKVTQYKDDGYDFLKIHPGIKREVFDEMARTAKSVDIDFSGHVPADVGIDHAIASGYATIDHLDGYIEGLAPEAVREEGGFFGVLLADRANEERIKILVEATQMKNTAVVPTQTLMTRWLSPRAPELMVQEPEMDFISPALRYSWRQNKEQMLERLNYSQEVYDQFIELRHKFLRMFLEKGVPILLGSDAPQVFNVPGFSLHHEMQSMVEAGLSNYEVLKSGTVNVSRFFNATDRGTVEEGKIADLVLIADNPFTDINNVKKINAVIYRGKIIRRDFIESQLSIIAEKYNSDSK